MIELVVNEFLNTFPFHVLGYMPFHGRLRFSAWKITLFVLCGEAVYLSLFALMVNAGISTVYVQYMAVPVFLLLMYIVVKADIGIIAFEFTFIIDYLLVVRALSFSICGFLNLEFLSMKAGLITFLIVMSTIFPVNRAMSKIMNDLLSVNIPEFWKTAWLLPFFSTTAVLLLTGKIRTGDYQNIMLISRVLLLICMFLISKLMILIIHKIEEQAETSARNQSMERILKIQSEQYSVLNKRILESRRERHDFRQHRRVIQDLAEKGDLNALRAYAAKYAEQTNHTGNIVYCRNSAVNAILSYYIEKAERLGIVTTVNIKMSEKTVIPDTELCVLIGNLLENAIEACENDMRQQDTAEGEIYGKAAHKAESTESADSAYRTEKAEAAENMRGADTSESSLYGTSADSDKNGEIRKAAFIKIIIVQNGSSMLSVAVDNSSRKKPKYAENGESLISAKHTGNGIGTDSIRFIALRHQGDARFEWKDGVFCASVMLNPQ